MTNRYSQWRWRGLSGNWSISPAPKISSLKPHHSVKALHSDLQSFNSSKFCPGFYIINQRRSKYISTKSSTLHYWLIWFCHICIMGYEFVAVIFNIALHGFLIVLPYIKVLRCVGCLQKKKRKGEIRFLLISSYTLTFCWSE